jgi:hypothetical protein
MLCLVLSSVCCDFFRVRDAAHENGKLRFVSCVLMVHVFAFDAPMCESNAGTFASVVVCAATDGLICVLVISEEDSNMESRYPSVRVGVPVNIEQFHGWFVIFYTKAFDFWVLFIKIVKMSILFIFRCECVENLKFCSMWR